MENFQKNLDKLINKQVKLTINNHLKLKNQTPFVNLNLLSRNPGSTPANDIIVIRYIVYTSLN